MIYSRDNKRDVLDHGYVKLCDSMGSDASIITAARASYDRMHMTGKDPEADRRRIRSMMRRVHTTPFESAEFVFEVQAPIFVIRQWMRHRTWTYDEFSGRYAEFLKLFYVPSLDDIGAQDRHEKQTRNIGGKLSFWERTKRRLGLVSYRLFCEASYFLYKALLWAGWPRELARMVLLPSIYTKMVAKVDLHNLLHFLDLRLDLHAQKEIRVYAEAIVELIRPIVPEALKAWEELRPSVVMKEQEATIARFAALLREQREELGQRQKSQAESKRMTDWDEVRALVSDICKDESGTWKSFKVNQRPKAPAEVKRDDEKQEVV